MIIAYDVGTTGIKTCIFDISDTIKLVASEMEGYELFVLENGGAEQDPDSWWNAMCVTTERVLRKNNISADSIQGISFCSQMQGLVLVDSEGNPVRRAMSYMDQRAGEELKNGMAYGLQIAGVNVFRLIKSLAITHAVAASVKDPVWKYKWVEKHEPEVFRRVHKWLDVKEFLISKCTGKFIMTPDSAYATLLYDTRKGREGFSPEMCRMLEVNMDHLPEIKGCSEMVGRITKEAAARLHLKEGTPVFGGGGDASLIGVGAGAVEPGDTHIYSGTSGWVSTVVKKQIVDTSSMIAAIVGADSDCFNYFAELETAGKCLEWVKDHLALDEIGIYLEKKKISDSKETVYRSLYDYMISAIRDVPPGSNGVIFTPWLHGNRCPFEDSNARGMFFNISLETGKTELIHSVLEGVCYHLRWMLEAQEKKIRTSNPIRFVGGGALAPLTCQILSDILGREIETVEEPQNAGSVGAALVAAVGLGIINRLSEAKRMVKVSRKYSPDINNKRIYDGYFEVFKTLYKNNVSNFRSLNGNKAAVQRYSNQTKE
ncbi:MAG TPA: carbohydrate kinase [Clostridiaceae bacterium]|nr:carbohydrate kinase [Clostridiaceae bacterium]